MDSDQYSVVTAKEQSGMMEAVSGIVHPVWPEFMHHDAIVSGYWKRLYEDFPEYQFIVKDSSEGSIVAVANSLPVLWERPCSELPDHGLDWAFEQTFSETQSQKEFTVLCAVAIAIPEEYRGKGISRVAVQAMLKIAEAHGLKKLIAPVRPNLKCLYPTIPAERYIEWKNEDGLPFDPWMRVHAKLGAAIVKVCRRSMIITGTVSEWESWTGMKFPEEGHYVVPGALTTVEIERDKGTYMEPNVWMVHSEFGS